MTTTLYVQEVLSIFIKWVIHIVWFKWINHAGWTKNTLLDFYIQFVIYGEFQHGFVIIWFIFFYWWNESSNLISSRHLIYFDKLSVMISFWHRRPLSFHTSATFNGESYNKLIISYFAIKYLFLLQDLKSHSTVEQNVQDAFFLVYTLSA